MIKVSWKKVAMQLFMGVIVLAGGVAASIADLPLVATAQAGSTADAQRQLEAEARAILSGRPYSFEVVRCTAASSLVSVTCEVVRRDRFGNVILRRYPYFRVTFSPATHRFTLDGPYGL